MTRLIPVTGWPFRTACMACGLRVIAGDGPHTTVYADCDGVPYKAYYCLSCAQELHSKGNTHHEEVS